MSISPPSDVTPYAFLLLAVLLWLFVQRDRRRRAALADASRALGLTAGPLSEEFLDAVKQLALLERNFASSISCVQHGRRGGRSIAVFEHIAQDFHIGWFSSHRKTVVACKLRRSLPWMVIMTPEHRIFRNNDAVDGSLCDQGRDTFSNYASVYAKDCAAVARVLTPDLRERLAALPSRWIETVGSTLLVHLPGRYANANSLAADVDLAIKIASEFDGAR